VTTENHKTRILQSHEDKRVVIILMPEHTTKMGS
jgi:hypothetical protein